MQHAVRKKVGRAVAGLLNLTNTEQCGIFCILHFYIPGAGLI